MPGDPEMCTLVRLVDRQRHTAAAAVVLLLFDRRRCCRRDRKCAHWLGAAIACEHIA